MADGFWPNSTMECCYNDDRSVESVDCEVRIQGGELIISYENEEGQVIYRGLEEGDGHYRLKAVGVKGSGTLHRFPGGDQLEGAWQEEGATGMWCIDLEE